MAKAHASRNWGKLGLFLLILCFVAIRPRTASDPVLPVQSGQSPSSQGTMVSGSVSAFSGTYSTSVPVEVLPGRNGLQPAVAISYASSNADGIAGVGWGIPSSSITRTGPKRGAPTYGDGDEFYMSLNGSGVQLMPMGALDTSTNERVFHTRVESWSKVVAHYLPDEYVNGNPALPSQVEYWDVWSKSGEHYYFGPSPGATTDQAQDYCLIVTHTGTTIDPYRNQWMLREVVDIDDNTMDYTYCQGTWDSVKSVWRSAKAFLPCMIWYGANSNLHYPHFAAVKFSYEARPDTDKRFSWRNGTEQDSGDMLANIEVGVPNSQLTDLSQVLREYDLSYTTSSWTGRSLLDSVVVKGGDKSLPPIRFHYAALDAAKAQEVSWSEDATSGPYAPSSILPQGGLPFVQNFFKDGTGDTNFGGSCPFGSLFIDLNGDGLPDKLDSYDAYDAGTGSEIGSPVTNIYLNPGPGSDTSTWQQVSSPSIPGQYVGYFYVSRQYQHGTLDTGVRFADINGDGIPDKIDTRPTFRAPGAVYMGRKDGTGWDDERLGSVQQVPDMVLLNPVCSTESPITTKFDQSEGKPYPPPLAIVLKPQASTAGGSLMFVWYMNAGSGVPLNNNTSVSYKLVLDGTNPDWGDDIPVQKTGRQSTSIAYKCYSPVDPGSYTFYVRMRQGARVLATDSYQFTVVPSNDLTPPVVAFTQTPPPGTTDDLHFEWSGTDSSGGNVTYQTWMVPASTSSSASSSTTADFSLEDLYPGSIGLGILLNQPHSFIVMGYDAAGNMTPVEWAFDGGLLRPWQAVAWHSGSNSTISSEEMGVDFVDVNGDGYADMVSFRDRYIKPRFGIDTLAHQDREAAIFNPQTGQWERDPAWTAHAQPLVNSYYSNPDDPNTFNENRDSGWRLVDVNGDGLPDFVQYSRDAAGRIYNAVCYNTGKGWTAPTSVANTYGALPGQVFAYSFSTAHSGIATRDQGSWFLDINGDGLPDKIDCYLDQDTNWFYPPHRDGPPNDDLGKQVFLNSGTGCFPKSLNIPGYAFSEGFIPYPAIDEYNQVSRDTGFRVTDLDGDGLPDLIRLAKYVHYGENGVAEHTYDVSEVKLGVSGTAGDTQGQQYSPRCDYLIQVDNPIGGKTNIYYKAAVNSYTRSDPNQEPPIVGDYNPGIPYVVDRITQSDGRGAFYTTSYQYAHPKWDEDERQFAGFKEVTVTGPDGVKSVTDYHQDFPLTGMVDGSKTYGNDGEIAGESLTHYEVISSDAGVYRVHKTEDRSADYENRVPYCTGVNYAYDDHDNAMTVTTFGHLIDFGHDDPGDEKTVSTTFINDDTNWMIGFVDAQWTIGVSNGSWYLTSWKKLSYQDAGSGHPVGKGHVSKETNWLDKDTSDGVPVPPSSFAAPMISVSQGPNGTYQPSSNVVPNRYIDTAFVTYNENGAIAARTDALGITTTFLYDSTNRFPVQKMVQGVQGVYTTYVTPDIWGNPTSVKDAKGVTTKTIYDGLSRPVDEFINYGQGDFWTKHYNYNDGLMGQPNDQYAEVDTFQPPPGLPLVSKAYYDGLGRTYHATSPGWQNQTINTETLFDPYGRVDKKSRPHFSSTQVKWVQYGYDARSRAVDETGFGKTTHTSYAVVEDSGLSVIQATSLVTGTGDDGIQVTHKKITEADAYGRTVMVQHDSMPPVYYQYDVMGALISAHEGAPSGPALVNLTYDSWGHKLTYQDYDSGAPTTLTQYCYDHAGRLIKQRDTVVTDTSKWRETALFYGGDLGQLTLRSGTDDTGVAPLIEVLSYYGANQGLNTGELSQRTDASGTYTFSTVLDSTYGATVRSETVAQITGTSAPFVFDTYKDWAGRTIRSILPPGDGTGQTVTYSYDPGSALPAGVGDGAGNPYATYTSYDETHLLNWTRGNGLLTNYVHDPPTDRLTGLSSWSGRQANIQSLAYHYYGDDQIRSIEDSGAGQAPYSQSFVYDGNMRLAQASGPYGTLGFSYDDTASGGRLVAKGSYAKDANGNPVNELVQLIYDQAYAHRVVQTSDGRQLQYDAWGNVAQETKPDGETVNYTYDAWNRMTEAYKEIQEGGGGEEGGGPPIIHHVPLADYVCDASGERMVTIHYKPTATAWTVMSFNSVSGSGYEVEQMADTGGIRTRWAIQGPNGVICWKQRITPQTAYFQNVGQRGEYILASIAWDKFKGDLAGVTGLFTGRTGGRGGRILAFVGAPPPARLLAGAFEASKDLWQVVSHGAKGFSFDTAAQRNAMYGGLALLGFLVLFVPYNRRTRRMAEKLLTTETQRHGEGIFGFAGWPSRARVQGPGFRVQGAGTSAPFVFSLLPKYLSSSASQRLCGSRFHSSSSARRGMGRQGCDLGTAPPSILSSLTKPHYYSVPPRLCGESSSGPLAPWTPGPFRFAARLLMLVMLFQGAIFFMPVQTQAQIVPCDATFYPLTDNLGSVNTLTDSDGNVVLTQHFLPFGEDFESPKPGVSTCNNNESWPYGFTGQYHDAETSLIYFHARYYNPAIGHFMSADSVVPNPNDTYSYDRYAYCRNNPVNLTDPTGHDPIVGAIIGAIVGGLMAWMNGGNILQGMVMGAIAGAMFGSGWFAQMGTTAQFWTSVAIGAGMGAGQAAMSGGNVFQAALIGGAGAAIGFGFAQAGATAGLGHFGQGVLAVMSGGVVGGLSNVAMGGDFWKGFTMGAVSAGLSFAANAIAGEIKQAQLWKAAKGALAQLEDEMLGPQQYGAPPPPSPGSIEWLNANAGCNGDAGCIASRNDEIQDSKSRVGPFLQKAEKGFNLKEFKAWNIQYADAWAEGSVANPDYIWANAWADLLPGGELQAVGYAATGPHAGNYVVAAFPNRDMLLDALILHEWQEYTLRSETYGHPQIFRQETKWLAGMYGAKNVPFNSPTAFRGLWTQINEYP